MVPLFIVMKSTRTLIVSVVRFAIDSAVNDGQNIVVDYLKDSAIVFTDYNGRPKTGTNKSNQIAAHLE